MKIVSSFTDYYDHLQDQPHLAGNLEFEFHRKTEPCHPSMIYRIKEKIPSESIESVQYFSNKKEMWSLSFFIIGFCDRLHRGVLMTFPESSDVSYTLTGCVYIPSKYGFQLPKEVLDNAEHHFSEIGGSCDRICQEIECPSFVILPSGFQSISIIKNPRLSDYRFEKSKASVDAYQQTKSFLTSIPPKKEQKPALFDIWNINAIVSTLFRAT